MSNTKIDGTRQILPASIDLTTEVKNALPISNGGTGSSTSQGAINALLPTQTSNARKYLRSDSSNVSWAFSHGNLTKVTVAASNASSEDKAMADYVCTGTTDDTVIQSAVNSILASGGWIELSNGTFAISSTINLTGSTAGSADNVNIIITGKGSETTILNCANNVNGLDITGGPKLVLRNFQIKVSGTGTGIVGIGQTVSPYWSFWDSEFTNIMIRGDFSTHTGYAMDLESPFRSNFSNIEVKGVKNGIRLKSHNTNFNPGNLQFNRCFVDQSQANGVAWTIQSVNGYFNICTFIQCEGIDSNSSSTTSIGWLLTGTSSYAVRNIFILNSNVEQFNTDVSCIYATDNDIFLNYADTKNNGTIFLLDANSLNNNLRFRQNYTGGTITTTAINDSSTSTTNPNILSGHDGYVASGGSMNITNSSNTIIREGYISGAGTVDYRLQRFVVPSIPKNNTYTPAAAGTATLDLGRYNRHIITMPAGNITIALNNVAVGQIFMVEIVQDSTGSRTVTWFTTIKWVGGTTPTLTTTANKKDTFGFVCTGSGTYDGYVIAQNI